MARRNSRDLNESQNTDIIIAVMGPTGAGKSTFINTATGQSATPVSHGLRSCTKTINVSDGVPYPGDTRRKVVFVDTPGFDDTYLDDSQILKLIAGWLASSYKNGDKLAGIIYLHEISQNRIFGGTRKNLRMFGRLCGDGAARNVILATTKWAGLPEDIGQLREAQLSDTYWKGMLAEGSRMARFTNTRKSAWDIIDIIVKNKPVSLLIQEELVDLQKKLPETEAAIALRSTLQELAQKLKDEVGAQGKDDPRHEETMKRLHSAMVQIRELKVSISSQLSAFFTRKRAHGRGLQI